MNKASRAPLTPLEVVDYKNSWRCTLYTNVYEHTFMFELVEQADAFMAYVDAQYPDRDFALRNIA